MVWSAIGRNALFHSLEASGAALFVSFGWSFTDLSWKESLGEVVRLRYALLEPFPMGRSSDVKP